jgi:hypothetical protein
MHWSGGSLPSGKQQSRSLVHFSSRLLHVDILGVQLPAPTSPLKLQTPPQQSMPLDGFSQARVDGRVSPLTAGITRWS